MIAGGDAERRLVTVLYADLVGHTELVTRLDPEDWRGLLQRYFAAMVQPIQRYGGTVEKFIGDAIFAVFGIPRAHEDDPARAVRAAVEMQEALERLNPVFAQELGAPLGLRIGIATGEAVAPGQPGGEQLVVGDLTTLAERLQRVAPPGGIVLSDRTQALVTPLAVTTPLGPLDLKGFLEPQRAALLRRLAREETPPGAAAVASPLVDRGEELAELLEAAERVRAGQGQIVFLIGEAGLGKSRLAAELRARLDPGVRVLVGRCHEFAQRVSHGAALQLLRASLDIGELDPPDAGRVKLDAALGRVFDTTTPEVRPALEHLLGLDPAGFEEQTRGLEPEEVRAALLRALTAYWERAAQAPVVLLVEDLHWVDAASADVLGALLQVTERASLMLLCAFRPERRSPAWELRVTAERDYPHRYREIRLSPLSPDETEELAAALLAQLTLPLDLKSSVARRAEGNPFYVEEVVRSLRQQGGAPAVPRIPDTLQGVLQARLDALPPPTRRILQAAAVIGRTFPLRLLQIVAGPGDGDLSPHLSELQRTDFLRELQRIPEPFFTFKHVLLQEAAYQTMLRKERRDLHRRLAETLEQEDPTGPQLAVTFYHFLQGEVWAKAVACGERAAAWARDVGAHEQAIGDLRQVVEILEAHPDAASAEAQRHAREAYGDLLVLIGEFEAARTQYAALKEQARTASARAHAERKTAEAYRREGHLDQAMQHLREALRILPPGADPVEEAWAHLDLGYIEDLTGGDPRSVLAHCERARVLAEGRDPMLNARVFRLYTIAYVHLGDMSRAIATARQAVEFAGQAGDELEASIAHNNLADVYKHRGELDLALEHVRYGLTAAARLDPRRAAYQVAILRMTQGELHIVRGEWILAQGALETGLKALETGVPAPRIRLEMLSLLAQALVEQGRITEALHLLGEAQALTATYPLLRFVPLLLRIRAEAHLAAKNFELAAAACTEGLEAAEQYGSAVERPALLRISARVAMERSQTEDALNWLAEAAELLEQRGQTPELALVLFERGKIRLLREEESQALRDMQEARERFLQLGALVYVAQIDQLLKSNL